MKATIALCIAILSFVLSVLIMTGIFNKKKLAYVRSTDLVYGYFGMKEAHDQFQAKTLGWKANIDTLQRDYQLAFSEYSKEAGKLSAKEKQEREELLAKQQKNLVTYSQALNEKAKQEDEKITQGVLNQVNSFVADYGKEKGYDIILGTTLSGNLMYGDEAIDITKEVLEALNKSYKGGKSAADDK